MGPKSDKNKEQGVRYHARERVNPEGGSEWAFEERAVSMMPTQMILVRLMIAKIENTNGLAQLLRGIPIRQGQQGWDCVLWVKEAFSHLEQSKGVIGTSVVGWQTVRDMAMSY